MLSAICDAQLRCLVRRVADAFVASPLLLVLACIAFAALPAVSVWAGRRAAPSLHAADHRLLLVSAASIAALAGVVVTLLVGDAALGRQLDAAPLPPLVRVAGLVLFPAALAVVAVAPAVLLFLVPVAGVRTPLVCARLLGFAALGAAGAEGLVAAARRSARGVLVVAGVGLLAVTGAPAALCPLALFLWTAAAAVRPPEPARRGTVLPAARGPLSAALARYARRAELRRQTAGVFALAAAAALALRLAHAGAAAAVFGAFVAVVGAAVVPLAAPGLDRVAEWLWRAVPVRRARLAAAFAGAALLAGGCIAGAGAVVSLAVAPAPPARLLPLAAALALVLPAALLAGALVPWRGARAGEQLAAYAVFGVLALALWTALARLAPLAHAEHGARVGVLVAACAAACVAAAVAWQGRPS